MKLLCAITGMYDDVVLKTKNNPTRSIHDEVDLPGYDIIQVDGKNNGKMASRNLSEITDQQDRKNKGVEGVVTKEKQDEYAVVKKVPKFNNEYNHLAHVHCPEPPTKNADIPIRASAIFPQEYESLGKAIPSSFQKSKTTDQGQLCRNGSVDGSPSPLHPPPIPPPIDVKDLPDGLWESEKEVTQGVYSNMVEVKAKLPMLDDPVKKDKEDGAPGMEIYMNVNIV